MDGNLSPNSNSFPFVSIWIVIIFVFIHIRPNQIINTFADILLYLQFCFSFHVYSYLILVIKRAVIGAIIQINLYLCHNYSLTFLTPCGNGRV